MKKKIWSNKAIVIIVVMAMLSSMVMVGCSNASDNKNMETAADAAQNPETESEVSRAEDTQQAENTAPTEEPEPTQEPTPEPTPEEEVVELPEIDERYEYHLYCCGLDTNRTTPLIGLNNVEEREWYVSENATGDECTAVFFSGSRGGEYQYLYVFCSHSGNLLETDEEAFTIVLDKEKKAVVDTAFGEAEIYWVSAAHQCIYDEYSDAYDVQEIDGKNYWIDFKEVASILIGDDQIFFQYIYTTDSSNHYKQGNQYRGVLEEVIAQMLEPK